MCQVAWYEQDVHVKISDVTSTSRCLRCFVISVYRNSGLLEEHGVFLA